MHRFDSDVSRIISSLSPERRHRHRLFCRPRLGESSDMLVIDESGIRRSGRKRFLKLNVGGQQFEILPASLMRYPNSMLGKLARERCIQADDEGVIYIDRSPLFFPVVLDLYRTGVPHIDIAHEDALREEAEFYGLLQYMFITTSSQPKILADESRSTIRGEVKWPQIDKSTTETTLQETAQTSEPFPPLSSNEGKQCNVYQIKERHILRGNSKVRILTRSNERLYLDLVCGQGLLLVDIVSQGKKCKGAVVFDSAAHFSSDGHFELRDCHFPPNGIYTFYLSPVIHGGREISESPTQPLSKNKQQQYDQTNLKSTIKCSFCGMKQKHPALGGRNLALCFSCHSRLLTKVEEELSSPQSLPGASQNLRELQLETRILSEFSEKNRYGETTNLLPPISPLPSHAEGKSLCRKKTKLEVTEEESVKEETSYPAVTQARTQVPADDSPKSITQRASSDRKTSIVFGKKKQKKTEFPQVSASRRNKVFRPLLKSNLINP